MNQNANDRKVFIFCSLALDILSKPPSTAQLESTFNGLKYIHTAFRSRLTKQRLKKLLYFWLNGRYVNNVKLDEHEYDMEEDDILYELS
jgi:hypothetical protein